MDYSNLECIGFNTALFHRPSKRWPTPQLNRFVSMAYETVLY